MRWFTCSILEYNVQSATLQWAPAWLQRVWSQQQQCQFAVGNLHGRCIPSTCRLSWVPAHFLASGLRWDLNKFEDPDVAAFQFKCRRAIELQHGRISMLFGTGYDVPEYFK